MGRALQSLLPAGTLLNSQVALRDILLRSFEQGRDLARFGMWLRLLAPTGAFETLVDLATQDFFHETGDPSDLKSVLESAAASNELDDRGKFWTLDALIFWDSLSDQHDGVNARRIAQMRALVERGTLGNKERLSLLMKQMIVAAKANDSVTVESTFRSAEPQCNNDTMMLRILRYNYGNALFCLGRYREAENIAESLYNEYYDVLGLHPEDVLGTNPPEIAAALGGNVTPHLDNLKRLADCLHLYAAARREQRLKAGLAWLHAMKFSEIAGAMRSAVKAGQEAVDDFVGHHDWEGARQVIENHVLPIVRHYGLTANMVPVRAQYAVILAYSGDVQAARREMAQLQPFAMSLSSDAYSELQGQVALIEQISLEQSYSRLLKPSRGEQARSAPRRAKIGRNQPCPCGSGKKYKRCCSR